MFESSISKEKGQLRSLTPENPPLYTIDASPNVSDINAGLSTLDLNTKKTRPTSDLSAHLKLLESFHQLREDIALHDGLFGIWDSFVPSTRSERERAEILLMIREKRWAIYVTKAASRFETWWQASVESGTGMLSTADLVNGYSQHLHVDERNQLHFSKQNLPPLDVIMVWHSYLLNPRDFLEDCLRYKKMNFWKHGLPLLTIDTCIDNDSFEYSANLVAQSNFQTHTGLAWDSLNDAPTKVVPCPNCKRQLACPWTTVDEASFVDDGGMELARGFADKGFHYPCEGCKVGLTHDVLRTQKFRNDLQQLLLTDVPMPGTILDQHGKPFAGSDLSFPNRLLKLGLNVPLIELTEAHQHQRATISDIRNVIAQGISDRVILGKAGLTKGSKMLRAERVSIRKMMSRYWENSSIFALDLIGAVIRQGTFIEKMHSIDWIHSPALASTEQRLMEKYNRYFAILAKYPGHLVVPTLDVDLAWHTHQLDPQKYYIHSTNQTGVFIDHDDKIDESKLSKAFEWTSKKYQDMYSAPYSECTCWYCEATRESFNSVLSRIKKPYREAESELGQLRSASTTSCDPHKGVHISAHNAIKSTSLSIKDSVVTTALLKINYQKAVKRAEKRGHTPPERDAYFYAMAYGMPMYIPYYAPYTADPNIIGNMYPANPSCANFTPGAEGNCAAGSCGGGVAAGACGGGTGGSCAGGPAGGHGGPGSGGCGGGGGGGCGGGGGGGGCGGGGGGGG